MAVNPDPHLSAFISPPGSGFVYSIFSSKFAQSSIVSYFWAIFYGFNNYRKLCMRLFFTNFVKLDPDPHFSSSCIRILIQINCWIWIRKKWMRIHRPDLKLPIYLRQSCDTSTQYWCCKVTNVILWLCWLNDQKTWRGIGSRYSYLL